MTGCFKNPTDFKQVDKENIECTFTKDMIRNKMLVKIDEQQIPQTITFIISTQLSRCYLSTTGNNFGAKWGSCLHSKTMLWTQIQNRLGMFG